jgi:hypothetical protein
MKAQEVIDRLEASTRAELAAVALYERGNRDRQMVLTVVDRKLRETAMAADKRGDTDA